MASDITFDSIRNLIINNKLIDAIKALLHQVEDHFYYEDLSILEARVTDLERKIRRNNIDDDKANIELNKIRIGVLKIISDLEKIKTGSSGHLDVNSLKITGKPPRELTRFFRDREKIRQTIYKYLNSDDARIITLIGRGGMGKTAIALKVLNDLKKEQIEIPENLKPLKGIVHFSNRTFNQINIQRIFQNISNLFFDQRRKLINQLAINENMSTSDKISEMDMLLKGGNYLLLFDEMERLLGEDGKFKQENLNIFFDEILRNKSSMKIIATSRVPITVNHDVAISSKRIFIQHGIEEQDSLKLLRELDEHTPRKKLKNKSDEQLLEIIDLVKGVPRALELVSAILDEKPLSLQRIKSSFFNIPDIMKKLVEDAYSNQNENTKRVLEALSVFKRAVPISAIEFLLNPFFEEVQIQEIVEHLYSIHIVDYDEDDNTIVLHPIDIDYAYSQIPSDGNYCKKNLELRAAAYYSKTFEVGKDKRVIKWVDPIFHQFEHFMNAEAYSEAARLLNEVGIWVIWQGYAKRTQEILSELKDKIKDNNLDKAMLYRGLGHVFTVLGPLGNGVNNYKKALQLVNKSKDFGFIGDLLLDLGVTYRFQGKSKKSIECYLSALENYKKTPGEYDDAEAYRQLARAYIYIGHVNNGINNAKKALEIAINKKDLTSQGVDKSILCIGYLLKNDLEEAKKYALDSFAILEETGERNSISYIVNNLGLIHAYQGNYHEAEQTFDKSLELSKENQQPRPEGMVKFNKAWLYRLKNNLSQALQHSQEAFDLFTKRKEGEAKPSEAFLNSLLANKDNNLVLEINSLIDCSIFIGSNPDLFNGRKIAEFAKQMAANAKNEELVQKAQEAIKRYDEKIIL